MLPLSVFLSFARCFQFFGERRLCQCPFDPVAQKQRCPVRTKAEFPLQFCCIQALPGHAHQVHRQQPLVERNPGIFEDGAQPDRKFSSATGALVDTSTQAVDTLRFRIQGVNLVRDTAKRADWPSRPSFFFQKPPGLVLALAKRRKIFHNSKVNPFLWVRKVNVITLFLFKIKYLKSTAVGKQRSRLYLGLVSRLRQSGVQKARPEWAPIRSSSSAISRFCK